MTKAGEQKPNSQKQLLESEIKADVRVCSNTAPTGLAALRAGRARPSPGSRFPCGKGMVPRAGTERGLTS